MAGPQGLQKQVISVPMGLGVDTRNNPVLVDKQRLTSATNVRFTKGALGELPPRNGYANTLGNSINGGGTLSAGQALANLGNEIDTISNSELYAYSPTLALWQAKAQFIAATASRQPIVRTNHGLNSPESATANGVTFYAWADDRGGVYFKVVDQASGTVLHAESVLDSFGGNPRMVTRQAAGGISCIYSTTAGALKIATVFFATPTAAPTIAVLGSSLLASLPFEAFTVPSQTAIAIAFLNSSSYLQVSTFDWVSLASIATTGVVRSVAVLTVTGCLDGNGNLAVATQVAGVGNHTMYMDFLDPAALTSVASYNNSRQAGPISTIAPDQSSAARVEVYVNVLEVGPAVGGRITSAAYIDRTTWDEGTGFVSEGVLCRGCSLISMPFIQNGNTWILVANVSTVQPTYFMISAGGLTSGFVYGRYVALNAGQSPPSPSQRLTQATDEENGVKQLAVIVEAQLESVAGLPVVVPGIDLLTIDFITSQSINSAQLGADLEFVGGVPQIYDGVHLTEVGFNMFPEQMSALLVSSVIGVTNIVDADNSAIPQSFKITIPVNQDFSGNDGAVLRQTAEWYGTSEYVLIGSATTSGGVMDAFWFSADGTAAPTQLGSVPLHSILVTSSQSASAIAALLAASITASIGTACTATASGNVVTVTAKNNVFKPRPATFSQFGLCERNDVHTGAALITCQRGKCIQPSQYFLLNGFGTESGLAYVWFTVDGVGSDPSPPGYNWVNPLSLVSDSIPVAILSTDTESQVANKLAAAFNAYTPDTGGVTFTASQIASGPVINLAISANISEVPSPVGQLPSTVGAGLGTVGAVAANQWDSYTYTAIYESQDVQGQLGRSAPAVSTQVRIPAYGLGNAQVELQVQSLYLTNRANVDVAIFRTLTLGSLFYRVTSPTSLLYNSGSGAPLSYLDSTQDSTLQGNELLYCQPLLPNQVIANNCPPSNSQLAVFQDQLWSNDGEDPQLWWFSKSFTTGVQVEWSLEQTIRFEPTAGPTIAAMAMDSNLLVFGSHGIWAVAGSGPDSTGAGQAFQVQLVSSAAGCRDPGSLALTPDGIIFKSSKGFMLINRGLQVSYIGDAVTAYNADNVVAADVIPNTNEVRFLCRSGTTLLYDYQYQQWCPHSNNGVDSIIFGGNYYVLTTAGLVLEEQAGVYADNGTAFFYSVTTAWLKPGAIQGFGRLWKVLLEGNFPSGIGVLVQIAYDYNPSIVDSFTFTPGSALRQFRVFPSRQTCQAMRLSITDTGALSSSQKLALNSIDLEVGLRKGSFKKLGNTATI